MSKDIEDTEQNAPKQSDLDYSELDREKFKKTQAERDSWKGSQEVVEKDYIPHFFPTFRILRNWYPLPIILVVIFAGVLAYLTYVIAGVDYIEGGYVSEDDFGAVGAGLINGIIFTVSGAVSSFIIILLVKKFGIIVLKYLFGGTFAFISFFSSIFFVSIGVYIFFVNLPETETVVTTYYLIVDWIVPIIMGAFTIILIYKYATTKSYLTKNFIVLYIGLLIGALMAIIMPLYATIFILVGFSLWDIFAVKSKVGPIKEMMDIVQVEYGGEAMSKDGLQDKLDAGEAVYDTSKLEIGIGDLAFYSMLTSAALIQTNNLLVMILTAIAVIAGTGITISGLKRNKILPGLPISIFLGIGTMIISWVIIGTVFS